MIVTAAMVVIAVVVAIAVMLAIAVLVIAVMLVIAGYIAWFVFLRSHKIHRPIAGVVFPAMLAPIFGVSWGHMQVHGRRWNSLRHNQHRLRIDERRRPFAAQLNLTVYARRDLTR
jgi:Na+/H+ antiporter NhaA